MRFFVRRIVFYADHRVGGDHHQLLHPADDAGRPGRAPCIARTRAGSAPRRPSALHALFGLDRDTSLWDQYVDYWRLLLHGDLGISFTLLPDARSPR